MPKSRNRRKKHQPQTKTIKLHPRAIEALEGQLEAFRKKFGRDPGPNDPVFFDPDCDEPVRLSEEKIEAKVLEAMLKAGTSPEFAYAYRKTGLLSFGGDQSYWDPADRREWEEAVAEYRRLEQAELNKPDKNEAQDFLCSRPARLNRCQRAVAPSSTYTCRCSSVRLAHQASAASVSSFSIRSRSPARDSSSAIGSSGGISALH